MHRAIKYIWMVLLVVGGLVHGLAQNDTSIFIPLSGNISQNKTLATGKYLIQSNLRIAREATLTIAAGSKIFFNPGAEIEVVGGLTVQGRPKEFVYFYSLNQSDEGIGISITGENPGAAITIDYAHFSSLIHPLNFGHKWYRSAVSISNSQFKNIINNDKAIIINEAEYIKNKSAIIFDFTKNVFADNQSSIYVQNFGSYNVQYNFTGNLFNNNIYFDYKQRAKNNVLYGNLDEGQHRFLANISNNAIINNLAFHDETGNVIDFAGIGVQGTAKNFELKNNYWGEAKGQDILKYVYGFNKDKFAPFINVEPSLAASPPEVKPFVDDATVDGQKFDENQPVTSFIGKEITLKFSQPLPKDQKPMLLVVYLDTAMGKIFTQEISDYNLDYSSSSGDAKLVIEKVAGIEHGFFLQFGGLRDNEGFDLPQWSLGRLYFNNIHGEFKNDRKVNLELFFANAAKWKNPPPVATYETVDPRIKELEKKGKTIELGVMGGITNYFGDLSTNNFDRHQIKPAMGMRFRYNFARRMSFRGMFTYAKLGGDDKYSDDAFRRLRNLNFQTDIYDLTAEIEYHLNYYVFHDRYRFIPSIGTGVTLFYFNPYSTYNGNKYYLQPLGTEGQTSMPGKKQYNLLQYGLPITTSLKTMVGYHYIVELEINFVKTFTDYLDDVSGKYADINMVRAQNTGTEDVASYFADPSGRYLTGKPRGDADHKDWYLMLGVSLSYRF